MDGLNQMSELRVDATCVDQRDTEASLRDTVSILTKRFHTCWADVLVSRLYRVAQATLYSLAPTRHQLQVARRESGGTKEMCDLVFNLRKEL